MDSVKCEALIRAIDLGSMSAAAEELGYTPSGIVRMINALENELDVTLVVRTNHGIRLTDAGDRILPVIREVVRNVAAAQQTAAEIRGLNIGNVRIGSLFSVSSTWLPGVIRTFSDAHPGIHVDVVQGMNQELQQLTERREIDCCIMSRDPGAGDWIALGEDRFVVIVPADSQLAERPRLHIRELCEVPFIYPFPDHNTTFDRYLEENHVKMRIAYTTKDNLSIFAMVKAGLGISVINDLSSRMWGGAIARVPLVPALAVPIGLYIPSRRLASPAAGKFISHLQKTPHLF